MNLVDGEINKGVFTSENIIINGLNAEDNEIILGFRAEVQW